MRSLVHTVVSPEEVERHKRAAASGTFEPEPVAIGGQASRPIGHMNAPTRAMSPVMSNDSYPSRSALQADLSDRIARANIRLSGKLSHAFVREEPRHG